MKHVSEIAAALSLALLLGSGFIMFNVERALAQHDGEEYAHPKMMLAIQTTNSNIILLTASLQNNTEKYELVRAQNELDHSRLFAVLEKMSEKMDIQVSHDHQP